jgi:hypothetical protein
VEAPGVTEASTMASPWLAGTPVAVVGTGRGRAGSAVRDALLDAGAAVATVGSGAPVPPGTRWVVDLAGVPQASERSAGSVPTPEATGTGPGDDDKDRGEEEPEPELGPDSVVLVTGGGRGIGARAAIGLARAFGCGVELVGRSPLPPDGEPSHLAGRDDTVAARLAIISRGELGRPGGIAVERDRILAAREIRRTLADLTEHAAFASYRALDVRDATALAAAIDDIRSQRGRLDGVVRVSEVLRPGHRGHGYRHGRSAAVTVRVPAGGADPAAVGAAPSASAPGEVA